jgi:hypothetical protein
MAAIVTSRGGSTIDKRELLCRIGKLFSVFSDIGFRAQNTRKRRIVMRRLCLVAAGTLILSALIVSYGQSPAPSPQTGATLTRNGQSQPVKAKKVLVKALPKKLEGIVLNKGVFMLKPGYKFIPQSDNTVAVGLKVGGGVKGSFECRCQKVGGCAVGTVSGKDSTAIVCTKSEKNPCSEECQLVTIFEGAMTRLAIF